MTTRQIVIAALLRILNSRWLNQSPCRYGFIGNLDSFSYDNLVSEEKQRPGITVKAILEEADRFRSCPINRNGVTVMDGDTVREATVWDLHEMRQSFLPERKTCTCRTAWDQCFCPVHGSTKDETR